MLDAALHYARLGWRVFPLAPRTKIPLFPAAHPKGDPLRGKCKGECGKVGHGFHDATTDEAKIRAWWTENPNANVGIATGAASGFDVLDIDGAAGRKSLATLEDAHGALPNRDLALTGGGGLHFPFAHSAGVGSPTGIVEAVDVRGDGGYVVVWPSVHPNGERYEWYAEAPPKGTDFAPWPEWLLELVRKEAPKPSRNGTPPRALATGDGTPWGRAALAGMAEELARAKEGTRDELRNALAFRAGRLVAGGHVQRDAAEAVLFDACAENGLVEDLGDVEVRKRNDAGIDAGDAEGPVGPRDDPGDPPPRQDSGDSEDAPPVPANAAADDADRGPEARALLAALDAKADSWPLPMPLDVRRVPAFPTAALPGWAAEWTDATAKATQTPAALPGCVVLGVLSAAVSRAGFRVEVAEGWTEPTNLYVVVAMPPAARKSPVFAKATAPLVEWERAILDRFGPSIAKAQAAYDLEVERLKAARVKAAKGKPAERAAAEAEALRLAETLATKRRPVLPRVFAQDVTPETLGALLHAYGGTLAVLSAEGGLFETLGGRYSDGIPNIDLVNNAHAGEPVRVDRLSREPVSIDAPALTIALAVQPDVLDGLTRKPGFRGRGLLARFAYAVPVSLVGHRIVGAPPVPAHVAEEYAARVRALLDLGPDPAKGGAERAAPVVLQLDAEAKARMLALQAALEPRLAGDLAIISDWGGKYAGLVARLAGLLHVGDGDHEGSGNVSASTVERAERIGGFFLAHALAAFDVMGMDPATEGARHVLGWLRMKRLAHVTKREMFEGVRGATVLRTVEALDAAVAVLVEAGYLRRTATPERAGPGRPRGHEYDVHPRVASAESAELADEGVFTDIADAFGESRSNGEVVP